MQPVWSLDIELQFYFIAPLLIACLTRYKARSVPRMALYAVTLVGFLLFVGFFSMHPTHAILPMYLLFFLIGMHTAHHGWVPRADVAVGLLGVAGLLVAACLALPATRPLLALGSDPTWLGRYNAGANIVLSLLAAPYAMSTVHKAVPAGSRLAKFDRSLGNISYEVYLLHWSALTIVTYLIVGLPAPQQLPIKVLSWIAVLPAAWVVYRTIDQPIDRVRSTYVRSCRQRETRGLMQTPDGNPPGVMLPGV